MTKKMAPPNNSPAMSFPKTLPLREYENVNSSLCPPIWREPLQVLPDPDRSIDKWAVYGTSLYHPPISNGTTDKSTAAAQVVDWEQEFEKSRQRQASYDATLKQLDKELEDNIAKLKADTETKKAALSRRILHGDRARLRELLARLDIASDFNIPEPEEQDGEKVETAKAAAMISPGDEIAISRYEKEDCANETPCSSIRKFPISQYYHQGSVPISSMRRTSGNQLRNGS